MRTTKLTKAQSLKIILVGIDHSLCTTAGQYLVILQAKIKRHQQINTRMYLDKISKKVI